MPDEIEIPTEHLHEHLHRAAHESGERWTMGVALSSALLAALAAVAALTAGHDANEAMIDQLHASDQWAYYQAKGIKAGVLQAKMDLLAALKRAPAKEDREKLADYRREQEEIRQEAESHEGASRHHLHRHVVLARAVTLFQIAIAVGAISVLTRRKPLWFVSLGFGALGLAFLVQGLLA